MNRRGFLTSMLKAGVAAAFLPGAGRVWKQLGNSPIHQPVAVINPEWVNAPFEVKFLWDKQTLSAFIAKSGQLDLSRITPESGLWIDEPYPVRYKTADMQNPIPPFVLRPY